MNKAQSNRLARQMEADGYNYVELVGTPDGGYALSLGEAQRIFYSQNDYERWYDNHHQSAPKYATDEWGGARPGAGRPRVRITLDQEAARILASYLETHPDSSADEVVSKLVKQFGIDNVFEVPV